MRPLQHVYRFGTVFRGAIAITTMAATVTFALGLIGTAPPASAQITSVTEVAGGPEGGVASELHRPYDLHGI